MNQPAPKEITEKICRKCANPFIGRKCKHCARIRGIAYYAENKERQSAKRAEYRMLNADRAREISAAWRKKNPEKVKSNTALNYAANSEKMKAAVVAWHAKNPGKMKEYVAKYRASVPEKVKARAAAYYEANSEAINARTSAYKIANPEKRRVYVENRRARESGGKLSADIVSRLIALQKGKCACCGKPLGKNYHLDHRMPLALGGTNSDENMQLLTAKCNLQKSTKHPIDFMQSRGFLL